MRGQASLLGSSGAHALRGHRRQSGRRRQRLRRSRCAANVHHDCMLFARGRCAKEAVALPLYPRQLRQRAPCVATWNLRLAWALAIVVVRSRVPFAELAWLELTPDNACESEVSRTKSQLRRLNLLGKGSPVQAHADRLFARRLLRAPGLLSVLDYRASRVNAEGHAPGHFLDLPHDSNGCVSGDARGVSKKSSCSAAKTL